MQVSSILSNGITTPPGQQKSRVEDFQAIQKALDSGDLAGAQAAFAQFKQDFHATHGGGNLGQSNVPSAIKSDLQGLQQALASGDLGSAQSAFAQLKSDLHPQPQPAPASTPASTSGSGRVDLLA